MKTFVSTLCVTSALALSACVGDSHGSAAAPVATPTSTPTPAPTPAPAPVSYTIGGTVTGLSSGTLTLQDHGGQTLDITANGAFTFGTAANPGDSYFVTVKTQPGTLNCQVSAPNGSNVAANVTTVNVSCAAAQVTQIAPLTSFDNVSSMAVDNQNNVYVVGVIGATPGYVYKVTPGATSGTPLVPGTSLPGLTGVAVDSQGNVYIAGPLSYVAQIAPGATSPTPITTGTTYAYSDGLGIDSSDNLYLTDHGANKIYKIQAGANITTEAPIEVGAIAGPISVAVDNSNNLYVPTGLTGGLARFVPGVTTPTIVPATASLSQIYSTAVDHNDTLFISTFTTNGCKLYKVVAGAPAPSAISSGTTTLGNVCSIQVDSSGNLYVGDYMYGKVYKIVNP
ncbi:hypothetical protein [Silvimonas amylolytica]|uniref:NHL repeat-containing protein n=1 Tax=Silvimonas amylolytica TaxID=449663 RepID=A0ABQ2PR58_9NEIS|nr:hypothetical protein [Silvimonas amylolytica]GGP28122.1 hypothetical protein GCM10010971_39410 [Silvimonas amylolytica]